MLFYNEDVDSEEATRMKTDSQDIGNLAITLNLSEILDSLARLEHLSSPASHNECEMFIKIIKTILTPLNSLPLPKLKRYVNPLDNLSDKDGKRELKKSGENFKNWKPIRIEGHDSHEDYPFNLFATYLLGKPDVAMSKILRVYYTFELINNIDEYFKEADDQYSKEILIKEAIRCAELKYYRIFFKAISNVISIPIQIVNPIYSNLIFEPKNRNDKYDETIHVLECGNLGVLNSNNPCNPTKFVLLIPKRPESSDPQSSIEMENLSKPSSNMVHRDNNPSTGPSSRKKAIHSSSDEDPSTLSDNPALPLIKNNSDNLGMYVL